MIRFAGQSDLRAIKLLVKSIVDEGQQAYYTTTRTTICQVLVGKILFVKITIQSVIKTLPTTMKV